MGDLSGVSPGWRGTDPHGGTWIANDDGWWVHFPAGGAYRQMTWRSQEEAEAAGLVRLIPAVGYHYDERGEDVVPDDEVQARLERNPQAVEAIQRAEKALQDGEAVSVEIPAYLTDYAQAAERSKNWRIDGFSDTTPEGREVTHLDVLDGERVVAAGIESQADADVFRMALDALSAVPAPLDPGNPEHHAQILRQAEGVLRGLGYRNLERVGNLGGIANRLDREAAARAEQDAADRKLSEQVADAVWRREEAAWHIAQKASQATLARVRAERARAEGAES